MSVGNTASQIMSASWWRLGGGGFTPATALDAWATSAVLMAIATAEPSPAAVMTCARGLVALPAAQTPGTLVRPSRSTRRSPSSRSSQPSAAARPSACARTAGRMKSASRAMMVPPRELHAAELVVVNDEALDGAFDDLDPVARPPLRVVCGNRITSSLHWRSRCACSTEPITPIAWSRTSQPWQ